MRCKERKVEESNFHLHDHNRSHSVGRLDRHSWGKQDQMGRVLVVDAEE